MSSNIGKLDVLLVNPMFGRVFGGSGENVPFGLRYMKSALIREGFSAEICNLDYSSPQAASSYRKRLSLKSQFLDADTLDSLKAEVENREARWWIDFTTLLAELSPEIIGITMMTPHFTASNMAARVARESCPDAKIIAGGVHCTVRPEEVMETGLYDAAVVGEGERTVVELAKFFADGGDSLKAIPGLCIMDGTGPVTTGPVSLVEDLDTLDFPARDLLSPPHGHRIRTKYTADIITTRGCPYSCTYCAAKTIWPRAGVRFRSIENIREEISKLKRDLEVSYLYIFTDTFNIRREHVVEFCEMLLSDRMRLNWHCYLRPSNVDAELAALMKRAGCDSVYFGAESGAQEMLDMMKKGLSVSEIREAVCIFSDKGFRVACSFILGHPDETEETMEATAAFARDLKADKSIAFVMTPFPGTEIFERIENENRLTTRDWFRYNMMNAHLIKRNGLSNERILKTALWIDDQNIQAARRESLKKLSPGNIIRKLATVRSPERAANLFRSFLRTIFKGI